jgi:hypothetical protein
LSLSSSDCDDEVCDGVCDVDCGLCCVCVCDDDGLCVCCLLRFAGGCSGDKVSIIYVYISITDLVSVNKLMQ